MRLLKKGWFLLRRLFRRLIGASIIELMVGAGGAEVEIDSEGIDFVSIDAYFVIVVFRNRTAMSFPAGVGNNLKAGMRLKSEAVRNEPKGAVPA